MDLQWALSRRRGVEEYKVIAAAALCGFLATAGLTAAAGQEAAPPDLSGNWELDPDRSDDPREKLRDALRTSQELERRQRGVRGGVRAGGARGTDDADSQQRRDRLEALAESVRVVAIEHRDPVLSFRSGLADSDWALTAYTDGREFERPSPSGESVAATAGWERGGRLVVRYEPLEGLQARETWELVAEGSRILLTTEVIGKSIEPVRYQRVYDRVEIIPWDVPDE